MSEMKEPLLLSSSSSADANCRNRQDEDQVTLKPDNGDDAVVPTLIFSSPAYRSRVEILFLVIGWGGWFYSVIQVSQARHMWQGVDEETRAAALAALNGLDVMNYLLLLFLVFLLLFVVPRHYQVYSDGSFVVQVTARSYRFTEIQSAVRNSSYCIKVTRVRWNFTTDLNHRVFVKRGNRKWEVSCSPVDPDGLVRAIEQVCSISRDAGC